MKMIIRIVVCILAGVVLAMAVQTFFKKSGKPQGSVTDNPPGTRIKQQRIVTDCSRLLWEIGRALEKYERDNCCFPKESGFAGLEVLRKGGYLPDGKSFVCWRSGKNPGNCGEKFSEKNCSFYYFSGLSPMCRSNLPIVMEIPGEHGTGNIAFLRIDGSVVRPQGRAPSSAREAVCIHLGKTSGFDKDELCIVRQAEAFDMERSRRQRTRPSEK